MEVSFGREVRMLRLGQGEIFHGEGILAITKALLQSGVAYVGGYQGAPVSHLMDVLVQSKDYLAELGVQVEACANEASAAAMLGASIHYPLRGAVTWKSIVGTNVAADALSNLASPGVVGGTLIVIGEDYGEGASVIQERTCAFALKSSLVLLDPRPDLGHMVRMVEEGFALSEASNTPVMLQLRIRACHVRGRFACKDNVAPALSRMHVAESPAPFDYARLSHPPSTFQHEKLKGTERLPAARRFIVDHRLNEVFAGSRDDLGLIVQGGLYNSLVRALQELGLADEFGGGVAVDARPQRHLPAGAGGDPRFLPRQARGARRRGRAARVHRAGDPGDPAPPRREHAGARQGPAGDGRRVHGGSDRARSRRVRRPARARPAARRRGRPGWRRSPPAARR